MLLIDPFFAAAIAGAGLVGHRRAGRVDARRPRSRSNRRRRAAAGALAGAALALLAGAALGQIGGLRDLMRDSAILGFAVPAPEGPRAAATPGPARGGTIDTTRPVQLATHSVVQVVGTACGASGSGTGWIGGDGIIVTNAHVVRAKRTMTAHVLGRGPAARAVPIWYEPERDVALLRAPQLRGVPSLRLSNEPVRRGTPAAVLGFPGGGPFRVLDARVMEVTEPPAGARIIGQGRQQGEIVRLLTRARPGNSGSPAVDAKGNVIATVFAGRGLATLAVPNDPVRHALRHARGAVHTGGCR